MRFVVCTVVHHPADARIYFRQIRALLDAGHQVTYIAPLAEAGSPDFSTERAGASLTTVTIPRASGRSRLGALRAARAALRAHTPGADLLLVHDPELLLVLPPRRSRPPTVWDVHEDTAAALTTKAWLPGFLRPVASGGVTFAERLAERRLHLILAEHGYNARFSGTHPVVPNTTYVPEAAAPPSGPRRVVYVGHISPDRGSLEMVALARLLAPHGIAVDLVGPADAAARAHIEAAGDLVRWHGFVPNEQALGLVDGALAGLSLLHDEANFVHSMPTRSSSTWPAACRSSPRHCRWPWTWCAPPTAASWCRSPTPRPPRARRYLSSTPTPICAPPWAPGATRRPGRHRAGPPTPAPSWPSLRRGPGSPSGFIPGPASGR